MLYYLIDQSFQGVSRVFVLPFENNAVRAGHRRDFLPTAMIDGINIFVWPIKNDIKTYENIVVGQGNDYATGCLLDYPYFKENCKLITTST